MSRTGGKNHSKKGILIFFTSAMGIHCGGSVVNAWIRERTKKINYLKYGRVHTVVKQYVL